MLWVGLERLFEKLGLRLGLGIGIGVGFRGAGITSWLNTAFQ